MPAETATTTGLPSLIESIRDAVHLGLPATDTAAAVAGCLGTCLGDGLRLPERYLQHIIHAEWDGSFSVVALVWLPGHRTSIHDHVSWCVTGVYEGEEQEERYELSDDGTHLFAVGEDVNPVGAISALTPPGDIHRVSNCSEVRTISLHVYGADIAKLGCSVRRTYTQPVVPA